MYNGIFSIKKLYYKPCTTTTKTKSSISNEKETKEVVTKKKPKININ
jgi:hypothetical protein